MKIGFLGAGNMPEAILKGLISSKFITAKNITAADLKPERLDYLKTKSDYEVFDEILTNQIQKPLSIKLKKVYPLAVCEIRIFKILKPLAVKKTAEIKQEVKEEKIEEIKEEVSEEKPKKSKKSKKTTETKEE